MWHVGGFKKCISFCRKFWRKETVERIRNKWDDDIQVDLNGTDRLGWIRVSQDMVQWPLVVENTVEKLRVPPRAKSVLNSWATIILSRKTLLRGISCFDFRPVIFHSCQSAWRTRTVGRELAFCLNGHASAEQWRMNSSWRNMLQTGRTDWLSELLNVVGWWVVRDF
jgi:hypothetical protein